MSQDFHDLGQQARQTPPPNVPVMAYDIRKREPVVIKEGSMGDALACVGDQLASGPLELGTISDPDGNPCILPGSGYRDPAECAGPVLLKRVRDSAEAGESDTRVPMGQPKTTLQPIGNNILIQPEPKPTNYNGVEVLPGSLYHPQGYDGQLRPFCIGRVKATGEGRMSSKGVRLWPDVLVGDRVVYVGGVDFVTDAPVNAEYGGQVLVREENIIAVLEG